MVTCFLEITYFLSPIGIIGALIIKKLTFKVAKRHYWYRDFQ
ncbi:hypothetical protein SAMD00020551_2211 [Mesobacillus selenatarsenatis SF-1]|uniref:Uncharacterized protein n=1 Tax=Mesobacillus selenatarsenatis (strain DSM 18680 / JCM 14380 / FERM P-15431 / SF-1) TaxID=1321606 RepID=A0A0A8X471_MESS1|nr:hypothetical protein SAMD00020551_2211 [Mesobacillus selenatarsenatis SF-1]